FKAVSHPEGRFVAGPHRTQPAPRLSLLRSSDRRKKHLRLPLHHSSKSGKPVEAVFTNRLALLKGVVKGSPLLAHLSGFERTLFAFARNATFQFDGRQSPGCGNPAKSSVLSLCKDDQSGL